ncbi:MAG TPA: (2Fe-2S)-binding protein [Syntrophomonadaceae bacterium]|nr:(2Fe-2S)-binding protein [Syntrophomonadaceae bacterium]HNX29175.1 (2Fe-2S)-binding protein [Syntrophomonadaceae bacterium]HPR93652.1 (2Fe-2S)-binding protein [Syntrophomonadaceae bacterium]
MKQKIVLNLNGEDYEVFVLPDDTLLDAIRDRAGLTGCKHGCDDGKCGACTVIMDGKAVRSCLMFAISAQGKKITTIEGLSKGTESLHPIQKAFIEHGAIQCGFCTPGMIMFVKSYLDDNPQPTEDEIRNALAGNICRCTGYVKIIDAVKAAAEEMRQ